LRLPAGEILGVHASSRQTSTSTNPTGCRVSTSRLSIYCVV
jgi:hypothetical protein